MASTATRAPRSRPRLRSIGAGAGGDVADAVREDRVGEDGRGAGAVADRVARCARPPGGSSGRRGSRPGPRAPSPWRSSRRRCRRRAGRSVFWMSTHFDLGPSVTRTASARVAAPGRIFSRASDRNMTCLYGIDVSLSVALSRAHGRAPSLPNGLARQAVAGGGHGLEPRKRDASPAALAYPVGALVQPREGGVDFLHLLALLVVQASQDADDFLPSRIFDRRAGLPSLQRRELPFGGCCRSEELGSRVTEAGSQSLQDDRVHRSADLLLHG